MPRGPLANSYPAAVALVVCSLIPYLALSSGIYPLAPLLTKSIGLAEPALDLIVALSTAAYAVGTVIAVALATHLPARRTLAVYEALFVVSSVLAAWAPDGVVFAAGFIGQGLCTSLMLIAAVPPLVVGWPVARMPLTASVMNLCVFGAVAAGPTIAGLQVAALGGWRPMFWAVAAVAAAALILSLLTFEDAPPLDPAAPWDPAAVVTAVLGCAAAFFGAAELQATGGVSALSLVPLLAGSAALVGLVVDQYRRRRPLMPVRAAATTVPVAGLLIALASSAAAFGVMVLLLQLLRDRGLAEQVPLVFLPELGAAVAAAAAFGLLFPTRWTPVFALGGLLAVVASAVLLARSVTAGAGALAVVTGLLGLGVGCSVSPALFLAGFSLPSNLLQRVFAMIELLRGLAAFLFAPVIVFLATLPAGAPPVGIAVAAWICASIAGAGLLLAVAVYAGGRPWLVAPDLPRWHDGDDEPAWPSPPLGAATGRRPARAAG